MTTPRYFVMTGGRTASEVMARAGAHGSPVRVVAHLAPSGAVYGAVEVTPRTQQPERARAAGLTTGSDEGAGATPVAGSGAATADHRYAPAPGELPEGTWTCGACGYAQYIGTPCNCPLAEGEGAR